MPTKITLDAYAASPRAVADLKENGELSNRVQVRSRKYLNNLVEQDHRRIKHRLRPMLGLMFGVNYFFGSCCLTNKCYPTGRCRNVPNFMGCLTKFVARRSSDNARWISEVDRWSGCWPGARPTI